MRVMGVMGRTERPDSEDCPEREEKREESGSEGATWSSGQELVSISLFLDAFWSIEGKKEEFLPKKITEFSKKKFFGLF